MALIQCPECQLQISDKALACPHCGYPLNRTVIQNNYKKRARRKRLPNGFGSITEINFPTYNEAYQALIDYNRNPYDLKDDILVEELYEK